MTSIIITNSFHKNSQTGKNSGERSETMSQSKSQQERQWTVRKQDQNPHGKVKSLKQLAEETGKGK
jgi:hypothetical protein